jgi:hypothetical protein
LSSHAAERAPLFPLLAQIAFTYAETQIMGESDDDRPY